MPLRLGLLAVFLAAGPAVAADTAPETVVARMKKDIFFLAGPECDGRGTGSEGNQKAGEYVAAAFKAAGLQPAPDGTYFQPFKIGSSSSLGKANALRLTGPKDQAIELRPGSEFAVVGSSAGGKATGGLVFVGYGIVSEKMKYDEYAGLDVAGKVVVALRRTPKADATEKPFDADPSAAALITKAETAAAKKAAAIIFVNDRGYGKEKDELIEYTQTRAGSINIPVLQMKRAMLEHLLAAQDKSLVGIEEKIDSDLTPRSVELTGWSAAAATDVTRKETLARNVVGVLPGAGPLAEETIVLGAHYDHVGKGEFGSLGGQAARGKVHFGADDNASGTTTLIELARRFGAIKDRQGRRIVFLAFSGEELGLLGSIHYCKQPLFPLDTTAFMLNMDMVGRSIEMDVDGKMKDRLVIYGHGTGEGLEKVVDDANKKYDFRLFKNPVGVGPSDQDSFYRKKVPVLFLYTGTHGDYHRPADTPDKINLRVMAKVADISEGFATHFAAVPEKPKFQAAQGGWADPTEDKPRNNPRAAMPTLGIMPGDYTETDKGVLVGGVSPGKAAEKAGIKEGDLIVEIAGKPVKNMEDYMKVLGGTKAGVEIEIGLMRKGKKETVKATPMAPEKKQ